MYVWIAALARNLRDDRRGAVAIQMGLIIASLIGMGALASEIGFVTYKHRQLQSAADAAAIGAAIAISKSADFTLQARALTAAVGIVNGADGVTVAVNNPPASGPYAGDASYVEVVIQQPWTLSVVGAVNSLTGSSNPSGHFALGVQAVALSNAAPYCMLGLDPTSSGAVFLNNNAIVQGCGVGTNSSSSTALILNNNASITGAVSAVGNWSLAPGATITGTKTAGAPALVDPFAGVTLSHTGATPRVQTSNNLQPGYYAAGVTAGNGVTLNFTAGVYYIGTQFTLGNSATVNANPAAGVTLVIDGNYQIQMGNNNIFNLTAPSSGATDGLALASIRTATSTVTQNFSNGATVNLQGAIYFPNQILQFDNNSTLNTPVCGELVARVVKIYNNANLHSQCGVAITGGGAAKLVQ